MSLKNLKLTAKLLIGFFILTFLAAFVGFLGFNAISKLSDNITDIAVNRVPSIEPLFSLTESLNAMEAAERTLLIQSLLNIDHDEQYILIKNDLQKADSAIIVFTTFVKEETVINLWKDFQAEYGSLKSEYNNFLNLSKEYDAVIRKDFNAGDLLYAGLRNLVMNDLTEKHDSVNVKLKGIIEYNRKKTDEESGNATSLGNTSKLLVIIVTIIVFALANFIGLFISVKIIRAPLQKLISKFNSVFEVKVNQDEMNSKDEIGKMTLLVMRLAESQKEFAKNILGKSKMISGSSKALLDISERTTHSSADLTSQLEEAVNSSEIISQNISMVSSSSEEMASSIKEISRHTDDANKVAALAQEKANAANEVMNELGKNSNEIGNIVKIITSIAGQTNLLALNATIEAARAGESGKGFAVVANEVKELAKESAKATEDITEKIKTIQESSKKTIEVIIEIIDITKKISEISNLIAREIEQESIAISEINRNLSDTSAGISSIVELTSKVSMASNEFNNLALSLKSSAKELDSLSEDSENQLKINYKL